MSVKYGKVPMYVCLSEKVCINEKEEQYSINIKDLPYILNKKIKFLRTDNGKVTCEEDCTKYEMDDVIDIKKHTC